MKKVYFTVLAAFIGALVWAQEGGGAKIDVDINKESEWYASPWVWLRKGEETFVKRLQTAFEDLNCINRNS